MTVGDMGLVERLRGVGCDQPAFTEHHAKCVCRLANDAADEIERLRDCLQSIAASVEPHKDTSALSRAVYVTCESGLKTDK